MTEGYTASVNNWYQRGRFGIISLTLVDLPDKVRWQTVATLPARAYANHNFFAIITSGTGGTPITRDGLITENNLNIYFGTGDAGKMTTLCLVVLLK